MSKRNHVWVVEEFENGKWIPLPYTAQNRRIDGEVKLLDCKRSWTYDTFRLRKYTAEPS